MHILDLSLIALITHLFPIGKQEIALSFGRLLVDFLHTLDMCTLKVDLIPRKMASHQLPLRDLQLLITVLYLCNISLPSLSFMQLTYMNLYTAKNIAVDSKIPDHRLITWKVIFSNTLPNGHPKTSNQTTTKRIPQDYFEDPKVHKQMNYLACTA